MDDVSSQVRDFVVTRRNRVTPEAARHDVGFHRSGVKRLHHPVVGDLALPYGAMDLAADPGLPLNVYTPEPDSPEQQALALLTSWADAPTTIS